MRSVPSSGLVHVFEPIFYTSLTLDNYGPYGLVHIHGSVFSADPGHMTSCLLLLLLGCLRVVCGLKGIYNVELQVLSVVVGQ